MFVQRGDRSPCTQGLGALPKLLFLPGFFLGFGWDGHFLHGGDDDADKEVQDGEGGDDDEGYKINRKSS